MIKKLLNRLFCKNPRLKSGDFVYCIRQNKTGHIIKNGSNAGIVTVLFCGDAHDSPSYYFNDKSLRKILSVSESGFIYEGENV